MSNHTVQPAFATGSLISSDGTGIGYRSIGRGPALVLVQGSMGTIDNFTQLAQHLSDTFAVYLPERRGRGISPKAFSQDHAIQRDVEDIAALIKHADARYLFGLSTGGIIALQAALQIPEIERLAVYEPPLFVDGPVPGLERFQKAMAAGDIADALVTAMKGSQMGPPILNLIPNRILVPLTNRLLEREANNAANGGEQFWLNVAPTLQFDFAIIDEASRRWQSYRDVTTPVLLLGGDKSPQYLTKALDAIEQVLPRSQRVELKGLDHGAAWNHHPHQNRRGDPQRVAEQLRQFYLGHNQTT